MSAGLAVAYFLQHVWGREAQTDGVFQTPRTPAFRVASGEISQLSFMRFTEARPLFVSPTRNSERRPRFSEANKYKNGCARKEINFLCICNTLVILMSIFNALTHLITLLLHSGHQFMHCTVLLCVQYNVTMRKRLM